MIKNIVTACLLIFAVSCSKIPVREELEYRNRLENEIIKTFPKKLTIIVHNFKDENTKTTNDKYLTTAIPDVIEGILEPMKSTLAYVPFDTLPFYVSESLSNLFQQVQSTNTNTNNSSQNKSYFAYLTNYLITVPVKVTQIQYDITTNTNYFDITTNTIFQLGEEKTNFTSNEILQTTTNSTTTNVVLEDRNLLTTTNMILLLAEEFPELIDYLSYMPIEIRRATKDDISEYQEYQEWAKNPKAWKLKQEKIKKAALLKKEKEKKEQEKKDKKNSTNTNTSDLNNAITEESEEEVKEEENKYPKDDFALRYHITGSFNSFQQNEFSTPEVDIKMTISQIQNTGLMWWINNNNAPPPELSKLLKELSSMDTNDLQLFRDKKLRLPFKRKKISPWMKDALFTYSTNFWDDHPTNAPTNNSLPRENKIRIKVKEDKIPKKLEEWRQIFHSTFVNRPYTALNIETNPPDTLVYLNGFFIGQTPLFYPTAPLGEQRISFIKEGYQREELLITVQSNQNNNLSFNLSSQNNTGILSVNASLPNADVFLNAQYKGKTPLTISNLTLNRNYRLEVLNPKGNISSNRNSVYKNFTLTEDKSRIDFSAQFKSYETSYTLTSQQGLLAGTYISWFLTLGLLGVSIYAQAQSHEYNTLSKLSGISSDTSLLYKRSADQFSILSQATLYTSIAGVFISSGIMGWYLYSKQVYLGLDYNPDNQEFFANFKLKF